MRSRLVNVRLNAEHLRKARTLRARGVVLSDLVREAIDERFEDLSHAERPRAAAVIARILEQHPDHPDLLPRPYDVRDRKESRAVILRKLRRGR